MNPPQEDNIHQLSNDRALVRAIKDTSPLVRCEVILALAKAGKAAKAHIPSLAQLQQEDPDDNVRLYAGRAVAKLKNFN